MYRKFRYFISSLLFLLVSLSISQHFSNLNAISVPVSVPIVVFLMLLCTTILMVSKDEENATYFYRVIFLISLYLVLDQIPSPCVTIVSSMIISYLPYLLFDFFSKFNYIPLSSLSKRLRYGLLIYSLVTFILLTVNFGFFYRMILAEIILTILFCIYLYSTEKDRLSTKTRKEQTFLTKSLFFALAPFILSYSLLNSVLPENTKFYSLIFLLLIPITVGIVLIRRNNIRISKNLIIINISVQLLCLTFLFFIGYYFIELTLFEYYYGLVFYFMLISLIQFKNWYLTTLELKKVQQLKTGYQREKLDLVQTITKEKTLSSISSLISKLLIQNYGINNYLVVWKDSYNPYILSCEGDLLDINLNKSTIESLHLPSKIFIFKNIEFSKYTFSKKDQVLGWFILDNLDTLSLTIDDRKLIDDLVEAIGGILVENERLFDIKQEAMKIENLSYDQYINFEYLNMVQNFQKDFSFFLHDNVLQNVLALKKLTESLDTGQEDTKQLMLKTFDNLNKIFRDKIFELYPSSIEKAPLSDSIRNLCAKLNEEQNSVLIDFYCPKDTWLEKEQKFHIYRIVQELVVNALKHSKATKINISFIPMDNHVECIVEDDGVGFDYSKIKLREIGTEHFGILSINQEVNSLNGQMIITSVKPHGTKFKILLPTIEEEMIF